MRKNRSEDNEWSPERAENSWTFHPFPDFSPAEDAPADLRDGIGCTENKAGENLKLLLLLI